MADSALSLLFALVTLLVAVSGVSWLVWRLAG
jgi:hypothetical protein